MNSYVSHESGLCFFTELLVCEIANLLMYVIRFICETKVKKKNQCCKEEYKLL